MFHWSGKQSGLLAVFMCTLLALTACGSPAATATPPPTATKAPAPTPTASAAATPTPVPTPAATPTAALTAKYGGTLTLAQTADPPTFNVYGTTFSLLTNHTHLTHNRLIRYKSLQYPERGDYGALDFTGDLLAGWDISADGTVYTLKLRHGVAWQNVKPLFGREVTSADVKASWDRMSTDPKSVFKGNLSHAIKVETPDRYTIIMTIDKPIASWMYRLADGEASWITAPDFLASKGNDYGVAQDSLVGTGPYIASKGEPGSRYVYVRNPDYFEKGYPYLDSVQWLVIPDASAREAAFVSGQVHSFAVSKPTDAPRIQKASADITLFKSTGLSGDAGGLTMNMEKDKWKDLKVRQAIRYLMPYQRIIKDLYQGEGAYDACVPTGISKFSLSQDELAKVYTYDPAKAKELLTAAGFSASNPFTFNFTLYTGYNQEFLDIATMFQAEADALGGIIKIVQKPIPVAQGRPQVNEGNFEAVMSTHATSVEPDETMAAFVAGEAVNYMRLNDPKVNAWYLQQTVETNQAKRIATFLEFNRYCAEQVSGIVPIPKKKTFTLQRGWVKNYGVSDLASDEPREKYAWIER